jgi:acetoacetate decarboxylase
VAEVPVLEIVAASHILADRSPAAATVVHYFKEPGGTGNGG